MKNRFSQYNPCENLDLEIPSIEISIQKSIKNDQAPACQGRQGCRKTIKNDFEIHLKRFPWKLVFYNTFHAKPRSGNPKNRNFESEIDKKMTRPLLARGAKAVEKQ